MKKSLQGHLLVASPHLTDDNFYRTVVLVIQHDADGALGLVLNRPGKQSFQQLWEHLGNGPCPVQQPIYIGGPVEGPLMALHANPSLSDEAVISGLYFSALHRENFAALCDDKHPFRLYAGYAGWGNGQLDRELSVGGWLILEARPEDAFSDRDADQWNSARCRVGEAILWETLRLKQPPHPEAN